MSNFSGNFSTSGSGDCGALNGCTPPGRPWRKAYRPYNGAIHLRASLNDGGPALPPADSFSALGKKHRHSGRFQEIPHHMAERHPQSLQDFQDIKFLRALHFGPLHGFHLKTPRSPFISPPKATTRSPTGSPGLREHQFPAQFHQLVITEPWKGPTDPNKEPAKKQNLYQEHGQL